MKLLVYLYIGDKDTFMLIMEDTTKFTWRQNGRYIHSFPIVAKQPGWPSLGKRLISIVFFEHGVCACRL